MYPGSTYAEKFDGANATTKINTAGPSRMTQMFTIFFRQINRTKFETQKDRCNIKRSGITFVCSVFTTDSQLFLLYFSFVYGDWFLQQHVNKR